VIPAQTLRPQSAKADFVSLQHWLSNPGNGGHVDASVAAADTTVGMSPGLAR